jgi:hypothetical protein
VALLILQLIDFSAIKRAAYELQRRGIMSDKLTPQPATTTDTTAAIPSLDRAAGARILARSFYRELRENGYTPKQLLSLSTELIDLITQDLQAERKGAA